MIVIALSVVAYVLVGLLWLGLSGWLDERDPLAVFDYELWPISLEWPVWFPLWIAHKARLI
jgi:hypothetical protein